MPPRAGFFSMNNAHYRIPVYTSSRSVLLLTSFIASQMSSQVSVHVDEASHADVEPRAEHWEYDQAMVRVVVEEEKRS